MYIALSNIEDENKTDAPFIGTLLSGVYCRLNCKNCQNNHLKNTDTTLWDLDFILKRIKENKFVEGIILGGLEWSEQLHDMFEIIEKAEVQGIRKIMIYTGLTEKQYQPIFKLIQYKYYLYIKYGPYNESLKSDNFYSKTIKLASENQYIVHYYNKMKLLSI